MIGTVRVYHHGASIKKTSAESFKGIQNIYDVFMSFRYSHRRRPAERLKLRVICKHAMYSVVLRHDAGLLVTVLSGANLKVQRIKFKHVIQVSTL